MEGIIYLEPDEEITSVVDKMKNNPAAKLFLTVPRDATVLQSVVNLKLLIREAKALGKEIALVTSDKIGQNLAAQVGLEVFDNKNEKKPIFKPQPLEPHQNEIIEIDMAKDEITPPPDGVSVHHFQERKISQDPPKTLASPTISTPWQKETPKKRFSIKKYSKGLWITLGLIVVGLIIAGFVFLPKTKVVVKVLADNFNKSLDVKISTSEATSFENKIMSGDLLESQSEKEEKFTATGKKNLGGKASGSITIYNGLDSTAHVFGSGTKLSSSQKTFVLKNKTTVPGATIQNGSIVSGTVAAEIEAENPGDDYNVKAGRFTIVGLTSAQQEKIYGDATKDLSGGFTKEVTVVSKEDLDSAREKLITGLNTELKNDLSTKAAGKEILDKAIVTETLENSSSAQVDQEATDFTLKIKQRMRAMVYNKANFEYFIIQALEKDIPYDKMITRGEGDNITPEEITPKYENSELLLKVQVNAKISSRIDINKVKKDLLGKSGKAAGEYLNNLAGADGYIIGYYPTFWIKRIPNYDRMLNVELEYVSPENNSEIDLSPSPSTSPKISPSPNSNE